MRYAKQENGMKLHRQPNFVSQVILQINPFDLNKIRDLGFMFIYVFLIKYLKYSTRHQLHHSIIASNFGSDLTRKLLASSSVTSLFCETCRNKIKLVAAKVTKTIQKLLMTWNHALRRTRKSTGICNLSIASLLGIKVSSLDARNPQKLPRAFSSQNLHRLRRKSLNSFGSCRGQTFES